MFNRAINRRLQRDIVNNITSDDVKSNWNKTENSFVFFDRSNQINWNEIPYKGNDCMIIFPWLESEKNLLFKIIHISLSRSFYHPNLNARKVGYLHESVSPSSWWGFDHEFAYASFGGGGGGEGGGEECCYWDKRYGKQ